MSKLEKFLIEVECPVCNDHMLNEIVQCIQGHSLCIRCREKITKCPFCEGGFTGGRNYSLEQLIASWEFNCQNLNEGCTFQGSAIQTLNHQQDQCALQRFYCPIKDATNCTWIGAISKVKSHMDTKHEGLSMFNTRELKIEILEYYNSLFKVLHRRVASTGNLEWCVQYVGPQKNADKYMFRLEFIDQSKSGFEAVFTGICVPYGRDKDAFYLEKVSIHEDTLRRFKNKTAYNYRITISQT